MRPSRSRVYVPDCGSVCTSTSEEVVLLNVLLKTTLLYGSTNRQIALAAPVRDTTSKKKRSPAEALKRYRSVSLAGFRLPLTGVPGVSGVADDRSLRRNE